MGVNWEFPVEDVMPPCYSYDETQPGPYLEQSEEELPLNPILTMFLTDPDNHIVVWSAGDEGTTLGRSYNLGITFYAPEHWAAQWEMERCM